MAARTIRQALIDEVFYPIPDGKVENVLLARGVNGDEPVTKETLTALNFSEADKSVSTLSTSQVAILKKKVNALYASIGESGVDLGEPSVTFGL